jgi:uncharacterized protein YndB with AHSA1/START domain
MGMLKVKASAPLDQPTITMDRDFDAPPAIVFRAFSDADAMKQWYGPDGFTITVIAADFRVGGLFRFIMHAPNGADFSNRICYREIVPAMRLAYRHGVDADDDPNAFEVENVFTPLGEKRTRLVRIATFPSIEARNAVMKFGAVELGMQTIEKLAAYVERVSA